MRDHLLSMKQKFQSPVSLVLGDEQSSEYYTLLEELIELSKVSDEKYSKILKKAKRTGKQPQK